MFPPLADVVKSAARDTHKQGVLRHRSLTQNQERMVHTYLEGQNSVAAHLRVQRAYGSCTESSAEYPDVSAVFVELQSIDRHTKLGRSTAAHGDSNSKSMQSTKSLISVLVDLQMYCTVPRGSAPFPR